MTFLPIVERELRVAARSRFTFWSRLVAATFALLIFGALQSIAQFAGGVFSAGQVEFTVLKWLAFAYAFAMGLFLTSDSLSEEKREGTLGLLFLTDLRGYDVVFGKLLTQSLRAFYGLLAAFPIMGLTLLAGGVTGSEFWRSVLVICNTLFFSLALGMLVSSFSRDSTKAMNATLLLMVLILGGLPFADYALAGFDSAKFQAVFSLASPGYLFANTGGYRFNEYWICLILQNALAWVFLILASLRTPHSWQEKSAVTSASRPTLSGRWRFGGPRARLALRRHLLDGEPLLWLTLRDRWLPRLVWTLTLLVLLAGCWGLMETVHQIRSSARSAPSTWSLKTNSVRPIVIYSSGTTTKMTVVPPPTNSSVSMNVHSSSSTVVVYSPGALPPSLASQAFVQLATTLQWLLRFALYLWVASQASRFFVDATRNGALELLLVTPVTPARIVRSQWAALWRTFLFPTVSVLLLQLAGVVLAVLQAKNQAIASAAASGRAAVSTGTFDLTVYLVTNAVISVFTTVASLAAVAWFGMWMGLTNRKTLVAVLKTLCFVLVLPWIAFVFVRIFISIAMIPAGITRNITVVLVVPALILGVLSLAKSAFFIWWAHLSLRVHFRREITQDRGPHYRPPDLQTPPLAPPPAMIPPALPPAANAV